MFSIALVAEEQKYLLQNNQFTRNIHEYYYCLSDFNHDLLSASSLMSLVKKLCVLPIKICALYSIVLMAPFPALLKA